MEARVDPRTGATQRAVGILKYTENDEVQELARIDAEQRDVLDTSVSSFLADRLEQDSTEAESDWSEIRDYPEERKALCCEQR